MRPEPDITLHMPTPVLSLRKFWRGIFGDPVRRVPKSWDKKTLEERLYSASIIKGRFDE